MLSARSIGDYTKGGWYRVLMMIVLCLFLIIVLCLIFHNIRIQELSLKNVT